MNALMGSPSTRVLVLTQFFDPEPCIKGLSFAKALQDRGFEVEVLTGFPNYPGGKVYAGYSTAWYAREVVSGVTIHRAYIYPSHDRSGARRAVTYVTFAVAALVAGIFHVRKTDVIYAYHPPATVGWVGAVLAWIVGARLVLDVQDLWPETVESSGMMKSRALGGVLRAACRWGYRRAAKVVALSPSMARALVAHGVEPRRVRVIYNWADERRLSGKGEPRGPTDLRKASNGRFTILFAGQIGEAQGIDAVLGAARRTPDYLWAFLGAGSMRQEVVRKAEELGLHNVAFFDAVPLEEVRSWLEAADVLLVSLKCDPLYAASIPSKLQAYLFLGKPILLSADGDARKLLTEAQAGLACAAEDIEGLIDGATNLASLTEKERARLGQNGRRFYRSNLSFDVGVERFRALFEETVAANEQPRSSW